MDFSEFTINFCTLKLKFTYSKTQNQNFKTKVVKLLYKPLLSQLLIVRWAAKERFQVPMSYNFIKMLVVTSLEEQF